MRLKSIQLENFRNYDKLDFTFPDSDVLILEGENGKGKTNFLEAIYLLALTKSFRARKSETMIQWGKDFFRVRAELDEIRLEQCIVQAPRRQKAFKKNEVMVPRDKFLGHIRAVLFRPEDLNMLILEPSLRRQYLNNILIQTDPTGIGTLQEYQKTLDQRNALLQSRNLGTLELWDEKLAESGEKIQNARLAFAEFLQGRLKAPYEVRYSASRPLKSALQKALESDLRFGHTSVGPHREDVNFLYEGHPASEAASRGELRRLMIQLKKAEMDWIKAKTGEMPILLLDDIFSELDSEGKKEILGLLPATQTIMTVAEGNPLPALSSKAAVRYITSSPGGASPKLSEEL